jgi:hypothetical protein
LSLSLASDFDAASFDAVFVFVSDMAFLSIGLVKKACGEGAAGAARS